MLEIKNMKSWDVEMMVSDIITMIEELKEKKVSEIEPSINNLIGDLQDAIDEYNRVQRALDE